MERGPPDAFFYLGSGPAVGRRHGLAPGFGFGCLDHIGPIVGHAPGVGTTKHENEGRLRYATAVRDVWKRLWNLGATEPDR